MVRVMKFLAVALFFAGVSASIARADSSAFNAPSNVTVISAPGYSVNLGMVFTANSNITVDGVGVYAIPGLTTNSTVAIYDSTGNLLGEAVVSPSDSVVNGYYYAGLAPLTLTAGDQYTVVEFAAGGVWAYGAAPTTDPSITFDSQDYLYSESLGFPTLTYNSAGPYYGPDFFIDPPTPNTAVPEPSTLLLFCTGLLAIAGAALSSAKLGAKALRTGV